MPTNTPGVVLFGLDAVIVAVTDDAPRVLVVDADDEEALPSGALDLERHQTLERGMREVAQQQAGIRLGYVEQLYTFGDRFRDPRERREGARVVSAAYLALVVEHAFVQRPSARFRNMYEFLPWEDWRDGRPALIEGVLKPQLDAWCGKDARRCERTALTFGLEGAPWDPERTLERYELLWEAGIVAEARRERRSGSERRSGAEHAYPFPDADVRSARDPGRAMAQDHRRMLATALGRLRGKIRYRPVVFELLPETFTLLRLQRVVEALAGNRLHKQNFRRLVEGAGLVEGTGVQEHTGRGRPAELFRFRREVFRERPAPGVYFPGAWWSQ
ncbi:MAG TPA: hypothetical protein VFL14_00265 [Xanthomonadales bacterium]|nr:hypothetical protein [Xanthomonadales bacterium]